MSESDRPRTTELVRRARDGDRQAEDALLGRHRERLRRMVAVRLDPRVIARLDPSDVVQEALVEAHRRLAEYASEPSLPFYPWLRRLAWERLVLHHRRHLSAECRTVNREVPGIGSLPDHSSTQLAEILLTSQCGPSTQLMQKEAQSAFLRCLAQLSATDRELLVLRFLERLSAREVASVLGISEDAVQMRQLRALRRLRRLLQ